MVKGGDAEIHREMGLSVASLRDIGWEPFTGMGRMKCVPELTGEITVACSADSVTVIEVRRHFYLPSK